MGFVILQLFWIEHFQITFKSILVLKTEISSEDL